MDFLTKKNLVRFGKSIGMESEYPDVMWFESFNKNIYI